MDDLWKHSDDFIAEYPVILSTAYSLRSSLSSKVMYDYVIVDEASQVDLATGALEVKAFNRSASPGFDIADFRMYEEEIIDKPYMLDAEYLIFGYDMSNAGVVTVKDLWLKKVWEITRCMKNWALNLQVKQGVVHKIRPGVWYSTQHMSYPMFTCLEDFIAAVEETVYQNPKTHNEAASWKVRFLASYKKHYGKSLTIPRWSDIAGKYRG